MSKQQKQSREVFAFLVNEEKSEYSRYKLPGSATNTVAGNVEFETFFDEANSYSVVVIKAEGLKKRILKALIQLGEQHFNAEKVKVYYRNPDVANEVEDEIKEMHNAFQEFIDGIEPLSEEPENVTFFIHWGGGDADSIKRNEEAATRFLRLYDGRSNWSVYSLSSLRKPIFDVTAPEIIVPNLEGLHRLKLRLLMHSDDIFARLQVACGILADDDCKDINEAKNIIDTNKKKMIVSKIGELMKTDGRKGEMKAKLVSRINEFPFDNHCEKSKDNLNELGLLLSKLMKGGW